MDLKRLVIVALAFAAMTVASAGPGWGQYREYHISGKVVDTQGAPVAGAAITLRDQAASRSYHLKTRKDGTFKFVGLPHGVYDVVFEKEGYARKVDTWRFEAPQDKMLKVEIPPVVLVSEERLAEAERLKLAASGVKEAAEKVKAGDADGALAKLAPILERDPRDPNALYVKGLALERKGMWAEAIEAFQTVAELNPSFAAVHYQLGLSYQKTGESEKALAAYEKAMALDPANSDAAFNAGLILFGQSRVDEALALFEKAMALRPDDPAYLEMAGRCHINKGDFPKAIAYLEKAKGLYASDPERAKFLEDLIAKLKEQIKRSPLAPGSVRVPSASPAFQLLTPGSDPS